MYYERFFHQQGTFWGWKCLFCSEIVDKVILENRIHFGGCEVRETRAQRGGDLKWQLKRERGLG